MVKKFLKFISGILLLVVIVGLGFFPVLQIGENQVEHIVAKANICPPPVVGPVTSAPIIAYPPRPKDYYANSPLRIETSWIKKTLIPKWILTHWLGMAAWTGTVEDMKSAIAAGADVNSFSRLFWAFPISYGPSAPPIVVASYTDQENNPEKIALLLANGADPNATNILGSSAGFDFALARAASNFDVESTRLLLEAGANINETSCTSSYCRTALLKATMRRYMYAANEQEQTIKLLLKSGATLRPLELVRDPLWMAVGTGSSPKVISWLIEARSKVAGNPILMMAASFSQSNPETIKILLAAGLATGSDWNARTQKKDWSPSTFKEETIFEVMDRKIRDSILGLKMTQEFNQNPENKGKKYKHSTYIDDPARIDIIRQIMLTARLVELSARGGVEEVREVIKGVDVNAPDAFQTPLMAAATDLKLGVAKAELLLDAGADPNGRNSDLMSPLQTASARENVEMVKFLLTKGAKVNTVDNLGRTPLWEALNQGRLKCDEGTKECPSLEAQKQIVELLLEAGAMPQPTPESLKAL